MITTTTKTVTVATRSASSSSAPIPLQRQDRATKWTIVPTPRTSAKDKSASPLCVPAVSTKIVPKVSLASLLSALNPLQRQDRVTKWTIAPTLRTSAKINHVSSQEMKHVPTTITAFQASLASPSFALILHP